MREREQPVTKTLKASEARQHFSQLLNQVYRRQTRVIVEKSGIPVAAIVSAEDLNQLKQADEEREKDFAIVDEIRQAFKDVPDDELEREVTKTIASVRKKYRRRIERPAKAT